MKHLLPHRTPIIVSLAAMLLYGFAISPSAYAQTDNANQAQAEQVTPQRLIAQPLVELMRQSLSGTGQPRQDQLLRAQALLEMALTLSPRDAELWRLRSELAKLMQDDQAALRSLQQYLTLSPADDAAQLELILAHLRSVQTLDERAQKVEGILRSGSGKRLSKPLRSRLAVFAAQAAAEMGDSARYTSWLQQAVTLDPHNPDAARLAYQFALQQQADAVHLGAAVVNLVLAAPADTDARLMLGALLADQAAFGRAATQFDVASVLTSQQLPLDATRTWAISLSATGRPSEALALLERAELQPADDASEDAAVLPAALELIRLAIIHSSSPGSAAADQSYQRVRVSLAQANAANHAGDADLAWTQLLFNRDIEAASQTIEKLREQAALPDWMLSRLAAWRDLRQGNADAARQQLEQLREVDPFAYLGLALLADGNVAEQVEQLQRGLAMSPNALAGLMAVQQLRALGEEIRPTRTGLVLANQMDRSPLQVWQPAWMVAPWSDLQVSIEPTQPSRWEPAVAKIVVRNTSSSPLAFDSNSSLPTRLLLSILPTSQGESFGPLDPIVVDIKRKLRLDAGQAVEIPVHLTRNGLGKLLASTPSRNFNLELTAILGPQPATGGRVTAQPLGSVATLRTTIATTEPITADAIEQKITQVHNASTVTQWQAIAWLTQILDELPRELDSIETRQRVGDAVAQAYRQLDPMGQAWTLYHVAQATGQRETFRRVYDLAQRSDVPLVRIVLLATYVQAADAPALTAALRHEDQGIRSFAIALQQSLMKN